MLVGTATGLLLKYYLDKKYIFLFTAKSIAHDTLTFALYTMMGAGTTLIFWGFEFVFEWMFQSKQMRYLGAVIGLGIGYCMKYRLDRHDVFLLRGQ